MKYKKRIMLSLLILTFILSACGTNSSTYEKDLQNTQTKLISIGAKAEDMLNMYTYLWSSKIDKKDISVEGLANDLDTTEPDIRVTFNVGDRGSILEGKVIGDYNSIINGLQNFYQHIGKIDELEDALSDVKSEVKKLNNPPKDYEDAFDRLLEMYSLTEEMAGLAISPSGSLVTFNEQRGQLSNDIVKLNKEIEVLLPVEQ